MTRLRQRMQEDLRLRNSRRQRPRIQPFLDLHCSNRTELKGSPKRGSI